MFMKEHSNIIALIYFQNAKGQFREGDRIKCFFFTFSSRPPHPPHEFYLLKLTAMFFMILFSHPLRPQRRLFANYRGELTARPGGREKEVING